LSHFEHHILVNRNINEDITPFLQLESLDFDILLFFDILFEVFFVVVFKTFNY
jgi:hypothetical protein